MTERLTPDICVIGAGAAGLTVAAAAAAFGVDVVLVERGKMGGECLNTGCVPSKALIAAASRAHAIADGLRFGIKAGEPEVDFAAVNAHLSSVIDEIAPNDSAERFTAMGVRVVRESAAFTDPRTVVAGDFEIRARRFVVATGSSPAVPAIPGLADIPYLTNETLFAQTRQPDHLIVIGGGAIGLEMAGAYRRLGSRVTVVEAATVLTREDPELVALLVEQLAGEGVIIRQHTTIERAERAGATGAKLHCTANGENFDVEGDALLVAAGRAHRLDDLGLSQAKIAHEAGGITVNANLRTSNRRVYAIGDAVSGGLQLTHAAGYQAGLVVQQILFRVPARERREIVPRVTFTDPELAHVGLSEADARARHRRVHVLRWPFADNDRAVIERRTEGLIKIVTDRKGRILGASLLGAGAGEMIGLWSLAVSRRLTVADLRGMVAPYPTMGEIGKRAALTYYAATTRRPGVRRLVRLLARLG